MKISQIGKIPVKFTGSRSVVVYDGKSGEVRHVHTVVTCKGAKERADDDVKREALELAGQMMRRSADENLARAESVVFSDLELRPDVRYKVDVKKRELIELDEEPATAAAEKTTTTQ